MNQPKIIGSFRKSQYSNTLNGILNCVEVARTDDGGLALRDSKQGDDSPVLSFSRAEVAAFFAGVKDDEFGKFPVS